MVHIKWLVALVLSVAASVAASIYFTDKYVDEIRLGQVSEGVIANNLSYAALIKLIEQGKAGEASARLQKWREIDTDMIRRFRKELGGGYFAGQNEEALNRMDRFLSAHDAPAEK